MRSPGHRIVLQVLPFAARDHAGVEGPVTVYEFADAPSVAYPECYGGGRIAEDRQEVGDLLMVVSLIRSNELDAGGSGGDCVEVAEAPGRILVRDTKQAGTGPVLAFSGSAGRWFVSRRRLVR